ncbi:MAG: hypothetical protein PVI53_20770, partial [Desulfobacteraceae bacterium]
IQAILPAYPFNMVKTPSHFLLVIDHLALTINNYYLIFAISQMRARKVGKVTLPPFTPALSFVEGPYFFSRILPSSL